MSQRRPALARLWLEGIFEKALVCTDLSDTSFSLIDFASQLKVIGVRRAVLTHVVDIFDRGAEQMAFSERGGSAFESQIATLEEHGIDVEIDTPLGWPAFTLSETAEKHDVSLIIVGNHGAGTFDGTFSGSTSSDLMNLSDRPLLLGVFKALGEDGRTNEVCRRLLSDVLFATDFSDDADRAFGYLRELVRCGTRKVTLLHVEDAGRKRRPELMREFTRSDHSKLEKLRRRLLTDGATDVRIAIPRGEPEHEVLHFLDTCDHSLVVLGAKGHGARRSESDLGSVSNTVVRHACTPLLLVPALRQRAEAVVAAAS